MTNYIYPYIQCICMQEIKKQQTYLMNDGEIFKVWSIEPNYIWGGFRRKESDIGSFIAYSPETILKRDFIAMLEGGQTVLLE